MPGYSPQAAQYRALNANSSAIYIGDQLIGFCQSTSGNIGLGAVQYYGIGTSMPQETQQQKAQPSITVSSIVLTEYGNGISANGQNLSYILANNKFDIHILDNLNNILLSFIDCVADTYRIDLSANMPVTQNVPFLAMDVWDAQGNSILNSPSNAITVSTGAAVAAGVIGSV